MKQASRVYHLFDAKNKVLGRLAVEVARILSGRGKVDFSPNIDNGDFVVIVNTEVVAVTGNKEKFKLYKHFSGYPSGLKSKSIESVRKEDSRKLLKKAVWGMLPKNKLRPGMMRRLKLYKDASHGHKTIHVAHN